MSVPFPFGKSFLFSFAEFVARLLGLMFLARFMDSFGLDAGGVFRTALPLIVLASAVGNVGLPTALTRWLAADGLPRNLRKDQIVSVTVATFCAVILTYGSLFALLSVSFIPILGIQSVEEILRASMPLLFVLCISGSLRGLMIGQGRNFPPALAQAVTALAQVALVNIYVVRLTHHFHMSGGEAGVAITTAAELLGTIVLAFIFWWQTLGKTDPTMRAGSWWSESARVLRNLRLMIRLTAPPTLQTIFESLGYGLELPMAEYLLTQHFGAGTAEQLMAEYAAVAIPLLHFPLFAADGLATALLPTLTAGRAAGGRGALTQSLSQVVRFSILLGLPSTGILFMFAPTLTHWLDAPNAAVLLQVMAPLALVVYVQAPLSALVQAHGQSRALLIAEVVGDVFRLSALWVGMQVWHLGIWGLILAFSMGVTSQTLVLSITAWKLTPIAMPWKTFSYGILATIQMCTLLLVGEHVRTGWGFHEAPVPWLVASIAVGCVFLVIAEEIPARAFAGVPVVGPALHQALRTMSRSSNDLS